MKKNIMIVTVVFMTLFFVSSVFAGLNDGLLAYYSFNGNANDYSGNGNNGIEYNGVAYGNGIMGQAVSLDGTDDYLSFSIGNIPQGNSPRTLSFWVKPSVIAPDKYVLSYGTHSTNVGEGYGAYMYNNSTWWFYGDNNDLESVPNAVTTDWQHISLVYTGTERILYKNGNVIGSDYTNLNTQGSSLLVGVRVSDFAGDFPGFVDELYIHDRALSASEVQQLAIVPEPISSILFITGGTLLAGRRFIRRKV
ncbi:MAG: LamG domain-containing protein [Nitrospirae bacterium]|nr:LamG domain-containing protein [Nitrospirota bacterium]